MKVNQITKQLAEQHGKHFTQMQYCNWAEITLSELQTSLEEPPSTSMFLRAGGAAPEKAKTDLADTLTQVADKITGALSPTPSVKVPVSLSPVRVIENCSKCYKQLVELSNLKSTDLFLNMKLRKSPLLRCYNT